MKYKKDISYGVIPYRKVAGAYLFFLIHQYSAWRGDSYWVFPKGHAEHDETPMQTALRELAEETGIAVATLNHEHPIQVTYSFIHEGIGIEKTVIYFLGEPASPAFFLQEEEVKEAAWFTYEDARARITFDNTKKALDRAVRHLTGEEC